MEMENYLLPDSELEQISGGTDYSNGGRTARVYNCIKLNVRDRAGIVFGDPYSYLYRDGDTNLLLNTGDIVTVFGSSTSGRVEIDLTKVPGASHREGFVDSYYLQFFD